MVAIKLTANEKPELFQIILSILINLKDSNICNVKLFDALFNVCKIIYADDPA